MSDQNAQAVDGDVGIVEARAQFRAALLHTHVTRGGMPELEATAGRFCMLMRLAGHTPQRTLIDAKTVIEETIDGDDATLATAAVSRCIEHYFKD